MTSSARFEFRAWSRNFAVVEDRIRRLASCEDIRESTEIYLVALRMSACNIKIRNGAVDTKALIDERDGLEQWQPEWNGKFPSPLSCCLSMCSHRSARERLNSRTEDTLRIRPWKSFCGHTPTL
jgi:hypothetical protein